MRKYHGLVCCVLIVLNFGAYAHSAVAGSSDLVNLIGTPGATGSPEVPEASETLIEKAQTIADTLVRDYGATSVQYAIIEGGTIILSGNSGVFSKTGDRMLAKDDLYGIGSTSKMFTTAAAMSLYDHGLIDLDAPLITYIPEFKMADPRFAFITPRMLMNHSSGIYGGSFANTFLFDDIDTTPHDILLAKLATQSLRAAPGEISEYCNDGFSLLELLVERVSGLSFTQYLARNFSQPLGLTHTKTSQDQFDKDSQLVRVYLPMYHGALPHDTVNAIGTGGLYSTAEDLCRFAQVLMGDKPEILSTKATYLMRQEEYKKGIRVDVEGDNLFGYGLGWDTVHSYPFGDYGIQAISKGGDTQLFHSSLLVIPEYHIAMAVISSGGASALDSAFAARVLQELLLQKGIIDHLSPKRLSRPSVKVAMPNELQAYSGLYANAGSQALMVVEDGILTVSPLPEGHQETYVYIGGDLFRSEDEGQTARFSRQRDGNIYFQTDRIAPIPGVGELAVVAFAYQKIEPVAISPDVFDAWRERAGKKYYVISEKPTSQGYFLGSGFISLTLMNDFLQGYAYPGVKIIDRNHAVNTMKFRDVVDMVFEMHGGSEYLTAIDTVYLREDFIPRLNAGTTTCTIGEDGFAQYYAIGPDMQAKTMNVSLPENTAYAVFDAHDVCLDFSTVSKMTTTVLPAGGKVVFIGRSGDVFKLHYE